VSRSRYLCAPGGPAVGAAAQSFSRGSTETSASPGLHHLCLRARERADVDELHGFVCSLGAKIIRAPREDSKAPGYYSVLFEDPDGIRLEMNHMPGKGLLA
jgi:catechol 2,3-dioxygenase-like lactoylglutathione lyase family enzyme